MDRQVERIIRQRNRLMKKCRALKMYGLIVTLLLIIAIAVIVVMAVTGGLRTRIRPMTSLRVL